MFTAVVYVLSSGCAWRDLPPSFGAPFQTAHRRFGQWTEAGLWRQLHHVLLDELGSQGLLDWSRAILSGRSGLSLSVAMSAANTNDSYALKPLVMAIPAIRSRRGPRRRKPAKLHADKAYDQTDLGAGSATVASRSGSPVKASNPRISSASTAG